MTIKYYLIIFCYLQLSSVFAAPLVITVGDVNDPNCDFNDIQSAIDSQVLNMDIRVSQSTITQNGIDIDNQPVAYLKGGYNNCEEAGKGIQPLEIQYSQISNPDLPAINIFVSESRLSGIGEAVDMEITGFEIVDSNGGIDVSYNGSGSPYQLELSHLKIHDNSNRGINLVGEDLHVTLNFTTIYNNANLIGGSTQGGGIRCANANLILLGQTAVYDNSADLGAGIYALRCAIEINAGDTFGDVLKTGIYGNTANQFGGGLYAYNSLVNGIGSFEYPLKINNNTALNANLGYGGGLYITSGSVVNLLNTQIDNNSAYFRGAGIYSHHSDLSLAAPQINLGRAAEGCSYAAICSSLSFNHIVSNAGIGGAVYLRNGAKAQISQTEISYNLAKKTSGFHMTGDLSTINLEGNLIHHNASSLVNDEAEALFYLGGITTSSVAVVNFNTIADNAVAAVFNLDFINNIPQNLEVYNSIISNPGSQIVNPNDGEGEHDANIDCSLLHDLSTDGIEGNGTQVGSPSFFGNLNYQLQENSLAIDPGCSEIIDPIYFDILGVDRTMDQSADLGAYESVVADSVIFANGFEAN